MNISKEDLLTVAKANSIKNGAQIIEQINTVVENWNDFAVKVELRKDLREMIYRNLHTLNR